MSHFGLTAVFDHAFMKFPLAIPPVGAETGAVLHLPCGTVPTVLTEYIYQGSTVTEMSIFIPGGTVLAYIVTLPPEDVQEIFAEGMHRLNRIPGGELGNVKPFDPS